MAKYVAGVDESGRGPLAGPVITAAVILHKPIAGIKDSKKLTPLQRNKMAIKIKNEAYCYAYGRAEVFEIDSLNIHHATLLAMARAIEALTVKPQEVLVDGLFTPKLNIPSKAIVNGDNLIAAIGATSILAKVLRDEEMLAMDNIYPGYGFKAHKGYATAKHRQSLKELGPCAIHRKHFLPVAQLLTQTIE